MKFFVNWQLVFNAPRVALLVVFLLPFSLCWLKQLAHFYMYKAISARESFMFSIRNDDLDAEIKINHYKKIIDKWNKIFAFIDMKMSVFCFNWYTIYFCVSMLLALAASAAFISIVGDICRDTQWLNTHQQLNLNEAEIEERKEIFDRYTKRFIVWSRNGGSLQPLEDFEKYIHY